MVKTKGKRAREDKLRSWLSFRRLRNVEANAHISRQDSLAYCDDPGSKQKTYVSFIFRDM